MKRNRFNIFLVDDDKLYLGILEHTLKTSMKNEVCLKTFTTGEDCVKQLKEGFLPHVIILDYCLNNTIPNAEDGLKMLRKIRTNYNIPIIMLSEQQKIEVAINSMKYGAYDYVVKNKCGLARLNRIINTIIQNTDIKEETKKHAVKLSIVIILYVLFMLWLLLYYKNKC